ncbi:MAG: SMP-30/gluconolactonase/LRE family protein [Bryobacteraceae bacterium]|nr:SMP-30/gluconolactonase/LRE family protein [Bryobacteraceae bacterium]
MRTALAFLLLASAAGAQNFDDYHIVKVAAGYTFTEGPAWSPNGYMLFSDVPNDQILKLIPGQKADVFREQSNGANGNNFDGKGRLYTCESRTRRVTRTDRKGNIEVLAEKWEGKRLNAPNDIVIRRDGHVYFTDPAFGNQADGRELDYYGVYHITPKGEMELIAKPEGRPNGIGLSPNGRILYVANSDERNIRAYDVDAAGKVSGERVLIADIDGPPDGIAIDEKGNIYVTANKLPVYSASGKLLHTIEIAETPANCAFGDPDLGTLYITARTSVYAVRLGVKGALQY